MLLFLVFSGGRRSSRYIKKLASVALSAVLLRCTVIAALAVFLSPLELLPPLRRLASGNKEMTSIALSTFRQFCYDVP